MYIAYRHIWKQYACIPYMNKMMYHSFIPWRLRSKKKHYFLDFEAPIFRAPLCGVNLKRAPSKKRQHEARKTRKDPVRKSLGMLAEEAQTLDSWCVQNGWRLPPCSIAAAGQQKMVVTTSGLESCPIQSPWFFFRRSRAAARPARATAC